MMRVLKWTILSLAATAALWAQTSQPRIQVQNYSIDANINPRTQSIVATAKIDFNSLSAANDVSFELNSALTVSKAVDGQGQPLIASRSGLDVALKVGFPRTLQKR